MYNKGKSNIPQPTQRMAFSANHAYGLQGRVEVAKQSRQTRTARGPHADAVRGRIGSRTDIHLHVHLQEEGVVANVAVFFLPEELSGESCPPATAVGAKRVPREGPPILRSSPRALHTVIDHFT